jgi:predicted transcriptional regulator
VTNNWEKLKEERKSGEEKKAQEEVSNIRKQNEELIKKNEELTKQLEELQKKIKISDVGNVTAQASTSSVSTPATPGES